MPASLPATKHASRLCRCCVRMQSSVVLHFAGLDSQLEPCHLIDQSVRKYLGAIVR